MFFDKNYIVRCFATGITIYLSCISANFAEISLFSNKYIELVGIELPKNAHDA